MTILDKQEIYSTLVEPKVRELWELCCRYEVPFWNLTLTFSDPEGSRESILRSSQVIPHLDQIPNSIKVILAVLNDQRFAELAFEALVIHDIMRFIEASATPREATPTHETPTTKQ